MTDDAPAEPPTLQYATEIVAAYLSKNHIPATDVSAVLRSVHTALNELVSGDKAKPHLKPAVPIKRSVTPEYIVCLEDGKHLKMLKRYLRSRFALTPDEYRTKWSLPSDYPMVAPNYAARRSQFAKKIGLGRTRPAKTVAKRKRA